MRPTHRPASRGITVERSSSPANEAVTLDQERGERAGLCWLGRALVDAPLCRDGGGYSHEALTREGVGAVGTAAMPAGPRAHALAARPGLERLSAA